MCLPSGLSPRDSLESPVLSYKEQPKEKVSLKGGLKDCCWCLINQVISLPKIKLL